MLIGHGPPLSRFRTHRALPDTRTAFSVFFFLPEIPVQILQFKRDRTTFPRALTNGIVPALVISVNGTIFRGGTMGAFVNEATPLSENGEAMQTLNTATMDVIPGATGIISAANWYAVQTVPRHEKKLRDDLHLRSLDNFLPVYEAIHRWKNGCKVRVELPLFPGYLFIKIDPRDRYKVLSLTGAMSIVGSPSGPWGATRRRDHLIALERRDPQAHAAPVPRGGPEGSHQVRPARESYRHSRPQRQRPARGALGGFDPPVRLARSQCRRC